VDVGVQISGQEMTVDFSEIEEQVAGPFNSGFKGGAETAARIAFKFLTLPGEPANEGAFRPLTVICPEGRFLNARPDAPVGLYSAPLATVIDTIVKALAPICRDKTSAGHNSDFSLFRIYGPHPETGALFNVFGSGFGGWGALDGADGPGPFKTMAHGDVWEVPIELHEKYCPVRVDSYEFRTDSGGPGKYRGGMGLNKRYRVLAPAKCYASFDRRTSPPWGVAGGGEGGTGKVVLHRDGEPPRDLYKEWDVPLLPGDILEVQTGGGGGFGPGFERNAELVALEVRRGFVSPEAAGRDYGVALAGDGQLDEEETRRLRAAGQTPNNTKEDKE
jgi:N-methylhydantoinase B